MTGRDRQTELRHLLAATAHAHHEATGGENPDWARWYAESMYDELMGILNAQITVQTVEGWLVWADEKYQALETDESWPRWYAMWFLEWDQKASAGRFPEGH